MKTRYLFILILSFFLLACGKDKVTTGGDNGGGSTEQPTNKKEVQISRPIFLDPKLINEKKSDTKIMDSIIRYVNHTPKGEQIHISIFLMSYKPFIDALVEANKRGVAVKLLIDNGREESERENKETILQLLSAFKSPSQLITLKSDASATAINHNKFVLFSKVELPEGVAKDLVVSSSHNFVLAGTKKIQDAVVMTHPQLYAAFLENWNETSARAKSGMKNFTYKEVDLDSIRAYFFPRRKNGTWDGKDTYLEILDKITDYASANVRVVMSDWSRVEVAQKLTELQKKGVKVEVIAKDKSEAVILDELDRLKAAGGYVKVIDMSEKNTHSKITLISGTWEGKAQKLVFTGSHNYTYNALKNNNEVLLMLSSASFFKSYFDYFDELKTTL